MESLNIIGPTHESPQEAYYKRGLISEKRTTHILKQAIWGYYFLLLFEGALRKWFFPSLAGPLLIVRDPLALWIILNAWKHNRIAINPYLIGVLIIGVFSTFIAILVGHGNVAVTIFGARILLFHFPLIFIIGSIFNANDVVKMGLMTMKITIPMTVLVVLQFYSPQSAWVNLGVGGDTAGAGFVGALGYSRPPGTFSFTTGNTQFYSFAACFILYFWLNTQIINKLLLICATLCLIISIPISISRSLFFQVCITVIFAVITVLGKPKFLGRLLLAVIAAVFLLAILSQINFFQTSIGAFMDRFVSANESEGGVEGVLVDRFFGGMVSAISGASDLPFFGYGIGLGTNVGAQLLTGERNFLVAEGEWARIIGELGALLGISIILIRVTMTIQIALASYRRLQNKDVLSWILLSFGFICMSQGGWAQPTSLGFCTLISGLMIAALRRESI